MTIEEIRKIKGGNEFADAALLLLPIHEKQVLFFINKVWDMQQTGDLELATLERVRTHCFNISDTRLKANEFPDFLNWWKYYTWLVVVCKSLEG